MLMLGGGDGMSEVYMLKRVGMYVFTVLYPMIIAAYRLLSM